MVFRDMAYWWPSSAVLMVRLDDPKGSFRAKWSYDTFLGWNAHHSIWNVILLQLVQNGFNLALGRGCDCPSRHKFSSSAWHHWTTQQVNPHFTTSHSFAHLITDAISIHSAQQCQVTLPLDYTCTAPVIRALVYSMVGPGWASCCEELNFHFPSSQVCVLWSAFSVLLKIFPSPYVLVFEPGGNYHCSFQN